MRETASHVAQEARRSAGGTPIDPADVMVISGYFADRPDLAIDAIYRVGGAIFVDVAPRFRSSSDPAELTTYRYHGVVDGAVKLVVVAMITDGEVS